MEFKSNVCGQKDKYWALNCSQDPEFWFLFLGFKNLNVNGIISNFNQLDTLITENKGCIIT